MTIGTVLALAGAMAVLAAIPSVSVLAVIARASGSGFVHGAMTSLGIVVGDIVFILVAILGLSFLAEAMGPAFSVVKYAGAAYLAWLGVMLWRAGARPAAARGSGENVTKASSFITGLLVTLGDQKAIFFYLGFFPAFLDLSRITIGETGIVIVVASLAVGGVKLVYAALADRARALVGANAGLWINRAAGVLMFAVAAILLVTG
ncbi:MAG: LysE family translocator [Proteobacteria bacterium]|nr:MAG: LysE family translocator [Pseudomonadota bacterium]